MNELLDRGATQLELAAALPHRSWENIRKRVALMRGKGFIVPESGQLEQDETIYDYLERNSVGSEYDAFLPRREFDTTKTLENAIAPAANIGTSKPSIATGMRMML